MGFGVRNVGLIPFSKWNTEGNEIEIYGSRRLQDLRGFSDFFVCDRVMEKVWPIEERRCNANQQGYRRFPFIRLRIACQPEKWVKFVFMRD